jgi:hypothetical protein
MPFSIRSGSIPEDYCEFHKKSKSRQGLEEACYISLLALQAFETAQNRVSYNSEFFSIRFPLERTTVRYVFRQVLD